MAYVFSESIIQEKLHMGYQNGKKVLPPKLLKQVQRYVQGECVYIPIQTPSTPRKRSDPVLAARNRERCAAYDRGLRVQALCRQYCLSPQAIYKILSHRKS